MLALRCNGVEAGWRIATMAWGICLKGDRRMKQTVLVPRTRSSLIPGGNLVANFGFRSGTRIIELASVLSIPKFVPRVPQMLTNFGIGTLVAVLAIAALVPA